MGILYLIQPVELIGTNRYKIGCSSKSNIDRVKYGYKKGTRYLHILECDNAFEIEKILKDVFNEHFTLIGGNEYFKGDENEMLELFYNVYKNNKNTETTNKIQESVYQEKCDKQYECDEEKECDEECDEECEELTDKDNESIKEVKTKKNTKYKYKCKYKCDACNFKTNDKNDYRRHLLTLKHKKMTENLKVSLFICDCGKEYKHKSGYYRHKKNCNYKKEEVKEEVKEEINYKELILTLLNQNKDLQELLITQQEEFMKKQQELLIKQQQEHKKEIKN
jgi:hypothetical protein